MTELTPSSPLAAAIMAGGRSSRMGRDKAFLMYEGERLVDRQIALLLSLSPSEIFISGRGGIDYGLNGVTLIHDEMPDAGPLAGLSALLEACTAPHLLILAVDMPCMTSEILRDIAAGRAPARGVAPRLEETWEPLAAVYPKELTALAKERLQAGRRSMRGFIEEAVAMGGMRSHSVNRHHYRHFFNWNLPHEKPS